MAGRKWFSLSGFINLSSVILNNGACPLWDSSWPTENFLLETVWLKGSHSWHVSGSELKNAFIFNHFLLLLKEDRTGRRKYCCFQWCRSGVRVETEDCVVLLCFLRLTFLFFLISLKLTTATEHEYSYQTLLQISYFPPPLICDKFLMLVFKNFLLLQQVLKM